MSAPSATADFAPAYGSKEVRQEQSGLGGLFFPALARWATLGHASGVRL